MRAKVLILLIDCFTDVLIHAELCLRGEEKDLCWILYKKYPHCYFKLHTIDDEKGVFDEGYEKYPCRGKVIYDFMESHNLTCYKGIGLNNGSEEQIKYDVKEVEIKKHDWVTMFMHGIILSFEVQEVDEKNDNVYGLDGTCIVKKQFAIKIPSPLYRVNQKVNKDKHIDLCSAPQQYVLGRRFNREINKWQYVLSDHLIYSEDELTCCYEGTNNFETKENT